MRCHHVIAMSMLLSLAALWSGAQNVDLEWVNPLPPRADLYRVIERGTLMVAVGAKGTIATSSDSGITWQVPFSGTTADLYGVSWGFGHFVAVGDGVLLTSVDGRSWTQRWSERGVLLLDVAFGPGRLVAVGTGMEGAVVVSENGTTWNVHATGWDDLERSIVWGNEEFLAAGDGIVYASGDGLDWTPRGNVPSWRKQASSEYSIFDRNDLGWDGQRYVWVGGMEIYTSTDSWEWMYQHVLSGCDHWSGMLGVEAEPGRIMVGAASACPDPYINPDSVILLSIDGGFSWSTVYSERGNGIAALARGTARFVAVGGVGEVLNSANGSAWTCLNGSCNADACMEMFSDAAQSGAGLLAVGGVSPCWGTRKRIEGGTVATSASGQSWSITEVATRRFRAVVHEGSQYVGVGENFTATSTDGVTWAQTALTQDVSLESILWADRFYVAVGSGGAVLTSYDGAQWSRQYSFTTADLADVAWSGAHFVAVGSSGTLIASADGLNWNQPTIICPEDLGGVAWDGEHFVVVGEDGQVQSSSDLVSWTRQHPGTRDTLTDVSWNGELLMAVGYDADDPVLPATAIVSADRVHWTRLRSQGSELQRVVSAGQTVLAMGGDRTLLQADAIDGPLIELDPPALEMPWGSRHVLSLRLSEPVGVAVVASVSSSRPWAIEVPASVTIPASGGPVNIPVDGVGIAEGVWITVVLPDSLGGRSAATEIDIVPPLPAPRRGVGRVGGRP